MEPNEKSDKTATQQDASERLEGQSIMEDMEEVLEKINKKRRMWIVAVFLLTSSPGIFNAYHIMVSVFYAVDPPHWCRVPQLESANWTAQQIKNISEPDVGEIHSCSMIGWNFTELAIMGYKKAQEFVNKTKNKPKSVPCKEFVFDEEVPHSSLVREWNLVCENGHGKAHVQGSIAVGKLTGGFLFGFLADRYGRKVGLNIACLIYIVSGTLAAFSPSFWFFLVLRFFIGIAGSGVYETGFTILAEVISRKLRPSLGCLYSMSYPVGYMTLPALAYFFPEWRHLQLAISLPMLVFALHFWFLPESPRWLVTQGKFKKAWKIIQKVDGTLVPQVSEEAIQLAEQQSSQAASVGSRLFNREIGASAHKVFLLFSSREMIKMLFITAYANFAASLVYYVLGLNAKNFGFNQYWYTFASGVVEIPGYVSPLLFLLWIGRKLTSVLLYFFNALLLFIILLIPKSQDDLLMTVTMLGRFTDVAMFGLIILYTSELFPTTVRNAAVGSSLAVSQFGSISAPYIVHSSLWQNHGRTVPTTLCGVVVLLSAALILLLPETRGRRFLDTIEQLNKEEDKVSVRNCCKCS